MQQTLQERLATLNDPRANDPDYTGFDHYPYYGQPGEKRGVLK